MLTAVFLTFVFCSCNSDNKTLIVNKWRPIAVSVPLNDSTKNELFTKTIIEFTGAGTYIITGPQKHDTGTYTLTDNGKTLTITDGLKKKNIEISIDTLTKDKFVFSTKLDGSSTTAVPMKQPAE